MRVKVRTVLELIEYLGAREVTLQVDEGSTVGSLLSGLVAPGGKSLTDKLVDRATGALHSHIRLLVNGRDVRFLRGLDTPLRDGDTLVILPPAAGG